MDHPRQSRKDIRSDIIRPKLFPPLFILLPHQLSRRQVKLARTQKPQQRLIVESIIPQLGRLGLPGSVVCRAELRSDEVGAELSKGGFLGLIPVTMSAGGMEL